MTIVSGKMMPAQKPGRSKQDYGTPPEFLKAVRKLLTINEFDIDLAANDTNPVCLPYYTEAHDSLAPSTAWRVGDGWNWLNPPFAHMYPWVGRAAHEVNFSGAKTAMLVPAGVGSKWWAECVDGIAYVHLLKGRLTFVGETMPYPKDCALLLYAPFVRGGYNVWDWRTE